MATMETADAAGPGDSRTDRFGAWLQRWVAGTPFDWGYVVLSAALICIGYYDAWLNRQPSSPPSWEHIPVQVAWLTITLYLGIASFLAWRRNGRLDSAVPEGYGLSVAGCTIFLAGILISGWWTHVLGPDLGVPAIFRLPNLLQIAGAGLIVVGPLRASAGRGELMAGPTAVLSAALLLATVTFFTQFDHPYIDQWAAIGDMPLPSPSSTFDLLNYREEILGALGLLMQTAAVTGVIMWTLRQFRFPVGSITLMLTATAATVSTVIKTPEADYGLMADDPKSLRIDIRKDDEGVVVYSLGVGQEQPGPEEKDLQNVSAVLDRLKVRLDRAAGVDLVINADKDLPAKVARDLLVGLRREPFRSKITLNYFGVSEAPPP